jgi:hypothetical protein
MHADQYLHNCFDVIYFIDMPFVLHCGQHWRQFVARKTDVLMLKINVQQEDILIKVS